MAQSMQKVVVGPETSKQEQLELAETFKMFDLNNDGHITKEELGTVMKQLGRETTDNDLQSELYILWQCQYNF